MRINKLIKQRTKSLASRQKSQSDQSLNLLDHDHDAILKRGRNSLPGNATSRGSSDGVENDGHWNLSACIDTIETLNSINGLTSQQRAAIQNLRPAAASGENNFTRQSSERQFQRRDAKFFGKAAVKALTKDLLACFREVESNTEDTDQQSNVTDVLATFGGEIYGSVFRIAPLRKSTKIMMDDLKTHEEQDSINNNSLVDIYDSPILGGVSEKVPRREAHVGIHPLDLGDGDDSLSKLLGASERNLFQACIDIDVKVYCPPEWNALTKDAREKLTSLLSWDNLSRWDFNVLDVAELSRQTLRSPSTDLFTDKQFCPLLFVGWAILCAPRAQQAMKGSLPSRVSAQFHQGLDHAKRQTVRTSNNATNSSPYSFDSIQPERVCNFLREIERRYHHNLSFHNNIHAADVTQTLHCLLQFLGKDIIDDIYGPIKIFSILLAATFHDVDHPGLNNLFQQNNRTQLAIRYNDRSILEHHHSSIGHSLLMGDDKKDEWDVFNEWSVREIDEARNVMISGVLSTDMTHHFEAVGEIAELVERIQSQTCGDSSRHAENDQQPILSILDQVLNPNVNSEGETRKKDCSKKDCTKLAHKILNFLLHASDISNPTKGLKLATYWADGAISEFFQQGDKEELLGLPISPLCDRRTVTKPDSQIGFLKFVIQPTYKLLGEFVPRVEEEVMPIICENINYWIEEKRRSSIDTTLVPINRKASRYTKQRVGNNGEDNDKQMRGVNNSSEVDVAGESGIDGVAIIDEGTLKMMHIKEDNSFEGDLDGNEGRIDKEGLLTQDDLNRVHKAVKLAEMANKQKE